MRPHSPQTNLTEELNNETILYAIDSILVVSVAGVVALSFPENLWT
jgi:hypothetical protein